MYILFTVIISGIAHVDAKGPIDLGFVTNRKNAGDAGDTYAECAEG